MGQPNRTDLQPPPEVSPPGDVPLPDGGPRSTGLNGARGARFSPPSRRPRRRLLSWLAMAAFIVLAYLIYRHVTGSRGAPPPRNDQPAAAITAAPATTGDMDIYIQALGTVTPIYTVTVFSQVTGRILNVYYREGQMVKKDDPLVDIDPRPFEANLKQAEGNLEHDLGLLNQAKINLVRYQAALARNAIARQIAEDQAQLVSQYEGLVKADQGAVDFNATQLSYCHIVAPIAGRVGLRLVDPGNVVFAGAVSTLVVITQLQPITVVFTVPEDDLSQVQTQLRAGHSLPVDAFDRSNEQKIDSGRLASLDNQVDTTTGTVKFRADFSNPRLRLFPNQFVNARLLVRTLHRATIVPTAAVQRNGDAAFIYVIQPNNTVAVKNVTVITGNERETAVTGINPGATVATSGFDRLENGAAVIVRPETEGNAKSAPPKRRPTRGRKSARNSKQ